MKNRLKRAASLLLAFVMLAGVSPELLEYMIPRAGAVTTVNISTAAQLFNMTQNDVTYILQNDITARASDWKDGGINGNKYQNNYGSNITFDGQGHTIDLSSITMDNCQSSIPDSGGNDDWSGALFAILQGNSTIRNVRVIVKFGNTYNGSADDALGGLVGVGDKNGGGTLTIENCSAVVTFEDPTNERHAARCGGLLGSTYNGKTVIKNSFAYINDIPWTGYWTYNKGGLVAHVEGGSSTCKITNSAAYIGGAENVTGYYSLVGSHGGAKSKTMVDSNSYYYVDSSHKPSSSPSSHSCDEFGTYMSQAAFESGEVCWKLNGSKHDGWFTQNLKSNVKSGFAVLPTSVTNAADRQKKPYMVHKNGSSYYNGSPYTLTFDPGGGTITGSTQGASVSKEYDPCDGLYVNDVKAEKTGYTFVGWNTLANQSKSNYSGWKYTDTKTIYAAYTANTYKVTLKDGDSSTTTKDVTFGGTYGSALNPPAAKTGYTFNGWKEGSTTYTTSSTVLARNLTVIADWSPNETKVSFDSNPGTTMTATYDKAMPGDVTKPEKTGYSFGGYYTGSNGSGTQFFDLNGTKTVNVWKTDAATATLYAKWTANKYKVLFDVDAADAIEGSTKTYEATYDTKKADLAAIGGTMPTRKGYTFDGYWTKDGSELKEQYFDKDGKFVPAQWKIAVNDTRLYAKWNPVPSKISFNSNIKSEGGNDSWTSDTANLSMSANTYTVTGYYELTYPKLPVLARMGYNFTGWYTSADCKPEELVRAGYTQVLDAESKGQTLYAGWEHAQITVMYQLSAGLQLPRQVKYLEPYGKPYELERPGYDFQGWWSNNGAGSDWGTKVEETTTVTQTDKHTVYAKYVPHIWTVSFDAAGGTLPSGTSPKTVTYDSAYGALPQPNPPAGQPDWTFGGWYLEQDRYATRIMADSKVKTDENHTLYAKWVLGQQIISFDVGEGGTTIPAITVELNQRYNINGEWPKTAARPGYTFLSWNTKADGTGVMVDGNTICTSKEPIVIYAIWEPNKVQIKLNPGAGATVNGSDTLTVSGDYGSSYSSAFGGKLPTPTRAEWTFVSWYNGGVPVHDGSVIDSTEPIELTAAWSQNVYTLVLHANGGTLSGVESSSSVNVGTEVELPKADSISRAGWIFKGWSKTQGAATADYTGKFTNDTNDAVVLYAVWERNQVNNTLQHYRQSLDGTYPTTPTETETVTADAGSILYAKAKTAAAYTGFAPLYSDPSVISGTVPEDKGLTLKLYYERRKYPVSALAGEGCAVSMLSTAANGLVTEGDHTYIRHGGKYRFKITLDKDFDAGTVKVFVNGTENTSLGGMANQELSLDVTADTQISVTASRKVATITPPAAQSGYQIKPVSGAYTAEYGRDWSFTVSLDPQYSQSKLTVTANGTVLTPVDGIYTILGMDGNVTLAVTGLTLNRYQVSYDTGVGYTIAPKNDKQVIYNGSHTFVLTLTPDYEGAVPVVRSNMGAPLTVDGISGLEYTYTLSNVTVDQHITVEPLVVEHYNVTLTASKDYSIVSAGSTVVRRGGSFSFTVNVSAGMDASAMVVTAVGASGISAALQAVGGTYTISNITEDQTVIVTGLRKPTCRISVIEGTGFSASPQSGTVEYGGSFTFTVTLDQAYGAADPVVKANYEQVLKYTGKNGLTYTYTLKNITEDTEINISGLSKPQYEITWEIEGAQTVSSFEYGSVPKYGAVPEKNPSLDHSYVFKGWRDKANDTFYSGALPQVTGNATYVAEFGQVQRTYEVIWVSAGATHRELLPYGAAAAFDGIDEFTAAKEPDGYYNYTFSGWSDGSRTYASSAALPTVTGPVTYSAQFTAKQRTVTLTLRYVNAATGKVLDTATETTAYNAQYRVTVPSYAGLTPSQPVVSGTMPAHDLTLTVYYYTATDTPYTVLHQQEGLDGSYHTADTETLRGVKGQNTRAIARSYDGFAVQSIPTAVIAEDGSTTIIIRYTRNSYSVTWDPNGGIFGDDWTTLQRTESLKYGAPLNAPQVLRATDAANSYAFSGWSGTVPETMPAGNIGYTAYWTPAARMYTVKVSFADQDGQPLIGVTPISGKFAVGSDYRLSGFPSVSGKIPSQTEASGVMPAADVNVTVVYYDASSAAAYTVEHYLADAAGAYGAVYETETRTGFAGRQTNESGKNYDGYTVDHVDQTTVTADGKAVVKAYYARRYYTATWDAGGGAFPGGAANQLTSVRYGSPVSAPAAPSKADDANYTYTFSGWYPSAAAAMPSYDVTYTAQYTRTPRTYKLTVQYLYADGTQAREPAVKENMSVGESYRIPSPDDVQGHVANRTVVAGVMPAADTVETVTYVSTSGVEYKVTHVREAVGGDVSEVEILRGITGAQTSALPRSYDGYTAQPFQQTTIKADGTAEVKIRYARNSYQVVWNGNGGTIGGQKTVTRTVKYGDTLTPPQTPVKSGDAQFSYAFAGWDPAAPQTMPAGDRTFFAVWSSKLNSYRLTVKYQKADGGEAAAAYSDTLTVGQSYTVSSPNVTGMTPNLATVTGTMPAADTEITVTYYPDSATRYTVKHMQQNADGTGYTLAETEYLRGTEGEQTKAAAKTYAGFKQPGSVTQQTISSGTETVVEIKYERADYTVTWNAGDGLFEGNAAEKTSTVRYGDKIADAFKPAKAEDDLFTYRFTGWSPTVAETMPAWNVTYTAQYERTAKPYTLTVLYRFADGTTAHSPYTQPVNTGSSYNVESPSIEGYTPNQSVVSGTMPAKDTEILVTYVSTKGVTYKVQHYLEQDDGTYSKIQLEEVQRGQPGAQTAAAPKTYDGYTAETPEQQTILANGSTTVRIKYARNAYKVTWNAAGGKVNGEDSWTQTVKFGAAITKPADPTRTSDAGYAYTFGGWDAEIPAKMPAGDLAFTAKWNTNRQTYTLTVQYQYENGAEAAPSKPYDYIVGESYEIKDIPEVTGHRPNVTSVKGTMPAKDTAVTVVYYPETGTAYTVKHLLQPVSGTEYVLADTETLRGETGKETKAAARSYPGFTAQRIVQKTIDAAGTTVVEVKYSRNEYTVTWNAGEGAFSGGEKSKTATYRYGAAIDKPENLTKPADANFSYDFTGWTPEVPETMPAQNVTYTAQYGRAGQSYQLTVTYKIADGTAAPEVKTETVTAGRTYRVVSPKVEGYTPSIAIVTGTMPAHDTEVLVTYYSNEGVQYKVVHKLQSLNGTAYEQADFELLHGQTGTQTRAEPKSYTGFTPQAIEQQTIAADGGTVVEILYTRNSYKVTWNGAGGTVNGEEEETQTVPYGGSISAPTSLAKDDDINYSYTFGGWDKEIPSEMPANDLHFIAQWDTDALDYTVTVHYADKDGKQAFEDSITDFAVGESYEIASPDMNGYFPSLEKVTGIMPANDLTFTVTYFPDANAKYIVKHVLEPLPEAPAFFAADDGILYAEETMGGVTGQRTQAKPMVIPGFTSEEVEEKTISGDTVVTIRYKRNEYEITWDGNDGKWGDAETQTTKLLYGQSITAPEEPVREADANSGYTFLSWGAALPETMPAENLSYVARWSAAARDYAYTIKFVCEDGAQAPKELTGTLAAGSVYTFTDFPALDGYVAIPNSLTGTMPASDLTLTVTYYPSAQGVPYKVERYMEQADGSYELEKTLDRIGIAGQMTAEAAEEIAHYTAQPVEQQKILGSGDTVVKLYYDRSSYTVTFDANGGTLTGEATAQGKWGAALTAPTATREGYTFDGWLPAFNGTLPQTDTTYKAQWKSTGGGGGGGGGGGTAVPDKPGTDPGKPGGDSGEPGYPALTPCDGGDGCPTKGTFLDNPHGSWYHDYVDYVFTNGLMNGVAVDRFAPDETLTRGMLVTILYRMAGSPEVSGASPFADVPEGKWYTEAILWATQTDVAGGYGNDAFGPDDPVTREQTAAILYRYAVQAGFDTDEKAELAAFADADEISAWAREAMRWCVQKGLLTGRTEDTLAPAGTATRAEIAAILSRYCGQAAK